MLVILGELAALAGTFLSKRSLLVGLVLHEGYSISPTNQETPQDMHRRAEIVIKEWTQQSNIHQDPFKKSAEVAKTRFPTIFHEMLSSYLPALEKSAKRLGEEGFVIIAAGGETTGRVLTAAFYYLLSNPDSLRRLRTQLEEAMPDSQQTLELNALEQLPWLVSIDGR